MNDTKILAHQLLRWLLAREDMNYEILSLNNLVVDTARKNDKRNASMKFLCPDQWVLNIAGDAKLMDVYLMLRVPREMLDEWSRARSEAERGPNADISVDSISPVESPATAVPAADPAPSSE